MSILVYKNEIDEFVCPKCGERLKLDTTKIDEIILSNKNMKDVIDGIKFNIDNIIDTDFTLRGNITGKFDNIPLFFEQTIIDIDLSFCTSQILYTQSKNFFLIFFISL